jgi:hypothetical protein
LRYFLSFVRCFAGCCRDYCLNYFVKCFMKFVKYVYCCFVSCCLLYCCFVNYCFENCFENSFVNCCFENCFENSFMNYFVSFFARCILRYIVYFYFLRLLIMGVVREVVWGFMKDFVCTP